MNGIPRKVMKVFLVLTLLLIQLSEAQPCLAATIEENELYAKSAVLMDATSGRVLYEKNGEELRANASTTKIMTLLVTLENADLEDIVTVSEHAARQPDVQLHINTDETYRLKDLCYSLMLESHNDAAVAIAEHVGGSVEAFAGMMNKKATEIGCENTHFVTPNGLDGSDDGGIHGTTARDLARIMSYAVLYSPKKQEFLTITQTPSYTFHNVVEGADDTYSDGSRSFSCNNHNAFLHMMEGAISGKTGFTCDAGYCYVGALQREGKTYVVALLACGWPNNKGYKWSDTRKLMEYGLAEYDYRSLEKLQVPGEYLKPLLVEMAQTENMGEERFCRLEAKLERIDTPFFPSEGMLLKEGETWQVRCERKAHMVAPIDSGTKVGEVQYLLGDMVVRSYAIVATENIEKIDYVWCLEQALRHLCM